MHRHARLHDSTGDQEFILEDELLSALAEIILCSWLSTEN